MRYAKIREMDVSNGEGIGVALFVQGCHFHCYGCFNPETWDFNGGKEWTKEIEGKFIELAGRPYIQRILILGGEPLANENVNTILSIIEILKEKYPNKKVWIYTGYLWEDILCIPEEIESTEKLSRLSRLLAVSHADIVVDGQFQIANQDLYHENNDWAGSTNQRVINVKEKLSF